MIPSRQEIVYRVYGAWRLARFDAGGLQYFDASPAAAARSFFAAVLVAPAFAITLLLVTEDAPTIEPIAVVLICILTYSLLWTVFPVLAYRICQVIGKEQVFFRYLSADNWTSVIGVHLQFVVVLLGSSGLLPEPLGDVLEFVLKVYMIAYSWFVCRHGLEISGLPAAGFVALQISLSFFIPVMAAGIVYHPAAG